MPHVHSEVYAHQYSRPTEEPGHLLPPAPVERRKVLSREDFSNEYLQGSGKPVVVTDATDRWGARSKWTFDFFSERCGSETILAVDDQIRPTVGRRLTLGDFLVYCQSPSLSLLGQTLTPHPLYASYRPFAAYPELLDDFAQPGFVDNHFLQLKGELRKWYNQSFGWLFFGPKGTLTPLHVDHFMLHSWLVQFVGRKRVRLFSPADVDRIPGLTPPDALVNHLFSQKEEDGRGGPDSENCLSRGPVRTYEAILGPGELIFIPAGWAHTVTSLDPSITMSFDVVNGSNFMAHLMMISRKLPQWSQKINTPAFRRANQICWSAKDFAFLKTSALTPEQDSVDVPGS